MITSQEAEGIAKKLYRLQHKKQETEELFNAEIEKLGAELFEVTKQKEAAVKPLDEEIEYLQGELKNFHTTYFAETGEKTLRLPHATLSCRKQAQDYLKDDAALLEWVQANAAEYVKIPAPAVAWGDLKKQLVVAGEKVLLKETGEVVAGLTPKPIVVEYKVEVVD